MGRSPAVVVVGCLREVTVGNEVPRKEGGLVDLERRRKNLKGMGIWKERGFEELQWEDRGEIEKAWKQEHVVESA